MPDDAGILDDEAFDLASAADPVSSPGSPSDVAEDEPADWATFTDEHYIRVSQSDYLELADLGANEPEAAPSAVSASIPGLESAVVGLEDMGDEPAPASPAAAAPTSATDVGLRALTAVGLLILFAAALVHPLGLTAIVVVLFALAAGEFYAVLVRTGQHPLSLFGLLGVAGGLMGAAVWGLGAIPVAIVTTLVAVALYYALTSSHPDPLTDGGLTVMVVTWALLGAFVFPIIDSSEFRWWVSAVVVVVVAMDVGQYFVGRSMGSRLLAPVVSPKKTVEGLLGGVAFAVVAAIVLSFFGPLTLPSMLSTGRRHHRVGAARRPQRLAGEADHRGQGHGDDPPRPRRHPRPCRRAAVRDPGGVGDLRLDGAAHLTGAASPVVVLGATGSIGTQALEVADRLGLAVAAVAARRLSPQLTDIASRYPDAAVAVVDEPEKGASTGAVARRLGVGANAVAGLAAINGAVVVNGIVGCAGLAPSMAALAAGNRLALANKETLVAGGELVLSAARAGGGEIVPVDSEHSAIWQCLAGEEAGAVSRLVLTASGGPLRGRAAAEMASVSVDEALAHPTWDMGPRITIDSATMMNKALEVVEAHHLFGVGYDAIDVVVHPQSVVHSMVEFVDGSVKAQLGEPDMRIPIQYAITGPARHQGVTPPLDLSGRALTFEAPDRSAFPCLDLGYAAGRRGGIAPAVLNAADEVAVAAFLDGRIGFTDIARAVETTLAAVPHRVPGSVDDVLDADAEARRPAAATLE